MRTTKKLLMVLVLAVVFVVALVATAFAAIPSGIKVGDTANGWTEDYKSTYEDIDNPANGWIRFTGSGRTDPLCRVQAGAETTVLVSTSGAHLYYNKTTKTGVLVATGNMAGDHGESSSAYLSSFTKSIPAAYYIVDKWADIEKKFAAGNEVWDGRIGDTGYPTSLDGTGSGGTWTYVYLIKSDYDALKPVFDTIDADETMDATAKKNAKATEAAKYSNRYQNKNVAEEGAIWTLGYLFKLISADQENYPLETLEFRVKKGASGSFQNFTFHLATADSIKTIKLDSRIKLYAPQTMSDGSRGLFQDLPQLVSLGHVVYEDYTGKYSLDSAKGATYEEGKVNLSGFTNPGSNITHSGVLQKNTSITDVIWYSAFVNGSSDLSGAIEILAFRDCTSLKTVTLTAPLTAIKANAFNGCTSLATIYLKGGVAAGATVDPTAFTSAKQAIKVYVYSEADEAKAKAIFADFANITVENKSATADAIRADGYSIRIDDTDAFYKGPALRAEFTIFQSNIDDALAKEGKILSNYGVVVFSENVLNREYSGNVEAIKAAIQDGLTEEEQKMIKIVSAANGPWVNKVYDENKNLVSATFAAAITGIGEDHYDSAVYTYAFAEWTKDGEKSYTYTTYVSERVAGKSAHSLYDATVFAFSNGVVNSQNFVMSTGVELWDILEKGAFTITKDDITAPNENLQIKYDLDNDTFTYLNEPLRAWKFSKYDTWSPYNPSWDAYGNYVEEESTTNVLWSILRDGDDLIVAYRRDPDAEANATAFIPTIHEGKLASAPYCSEYFDGIELVWEGGKQVPKERFVDTAGGNGIVKGSYVYTPIVSESVEERITTLVVDYGITNFKYRALGNSKTPSLTKIIYPENVSASSGLLAGNSYIESFIYAPVGIHQLPTETWAEGFGPVADLSGLKSFSFASAFDGCYKIQNLLLPQMTKSSTDIQTTFNGMRALKRAWTCGSPVPNEGTLDFSKTRITTICKRSFADFQMSKTMDLTLIMPETFTGIAAYSLKLSEKDACSEVFGKDLAYTIDLGENVAALTSSTKGLLLFYERMLEANNDLDNNGKLGNQANYKGTGDVVYLVYELEDAQADNMNKIMITCKVNGVKQTLSLADWRTYCIDNDLYETTLAE